MTVPLSASFFHFKTQAEPVRKQIKITAIMAMQTKATAPRIIIPREPW